MSNQAKGLDHPRLASLPSDGSPPPELQAVANRGLRVDPGVWYDRVVRAIGELRGTDDEAHADAERSMLCYARPVLEAARKGRVVSSRWEQDKAGGRWYPKDPLLLQVTKSYGLRDAIVPEKGHAFVVADWNSSHPRIAAGLTGDEQMLADLEGGALYDKAIDVLRPTDRDPRRAAKVAICGLLNGMGDKRLGEVLGVDKAEAATRRGAVLERWPGLGRAIDAGRIWWSWTSPLGRACAVSAARRAKIGTCTGWVMQSFEADAMRVVLHELRDTRIVFMAHDEVVVEVPLGDAEAMRSRVRDVMDRALRWAARSPEGDPESTTSVEIRPSWSGAVPEPLPDPGGDFIFPNGPLGERPSHPRVELQLAIDAGTPPAKLHASPWVHTFLEHEDLTCELPARKEAALRRAARAARARLGKQIEDRRRINADARRRRGGSAIPLTLDGRPYLLVKGDGYRVALPSGGYREVPPKLVPVVLRRHWPDLEYKITVYSKKGEPSERALTTEELYERYGQALNRLAYTYHASTDTWVPTGDFGGDLTIRVPFAPRPEARFDARIDEYLRVLIPDPNLLELVLDWLSVVFVLHRPVAVLVLKGPAGCGKSMLASGIGAALGAEVGKYDDAMKERFNGILLRTPILELDERSMHRGLASAFRSLSANSRHAVEPKGKETVTLHGCPRIVVATQNDDPLRLYNDALTVEGQKALGRRIIHVDVSGDAAQWLRDHGGRGGLSKDWIYKEGTQVPGAFPRHIAWLASTRSERVLAEGLAEGRRLLIEGSESAWLSSIGSRVGLGSSVIEALRVWLEDLSYWQKKHAPVAWLPPDEPEHLHVSNANLRKHWKELLGESEPVPRRDQLQRTLGVLGTEARLEQGFRPDGTRIRQRTHRIHAATHGLDLSPARRAP